VPYNCTVNNITSNGLSVNFRHGYDGVLTHFVNLQVLQTKTDNRAVFNATVGPRSAGLTIYITKAPNRETLAFTQ
jgi:hypothetical protein